MRIRQKWIKGILTVIFGICAATSVYPLLWMLINSFKDTSEIMTGESLALAEYQAHYETLPQNQTNRAQKVTFISKHLELTQLCIVSVLHIIKTMLFLQG